MMEVNINNSENLETSEEEKERLADEVLKPVEEKLLSTNWKIRKSAYSEIIDDIRHISQKFNPQERSSEIDQYLSRIQLSFEKILEDSIAVSLETGLDVIILIVKNHTNLSQEKKDDIFRLTIEKAYACSKTVTKEKSKELIVTILQNSMDIQLQFEIIKAILEYPIKKIKIIMLAEQILQYLFSEYGCQIIDFKFFMPTIVKLVQCTNHGIKYEAMELLKEIYRQVRSDIIPHLREVKETLIKDIRNNFEKIDDNEPEPKIVDKILIGNEPEIGDSLIIPSKEVIERSLGCSPSNLDSNLHNNSSTNLNIPRRNSSVISFEGKKEMYLHELYNDDIVEDLLSKEKKWMDKKEILDEFTKNLHNCKIVNTGSLIDYDNLFYACRQLLKDTNLNVIQSTLNLVNCLSIQLGKPFATYAKEYLPWILEKFKEKKDKLNKEIITTLSSFLKYNLTLDEIVPVLCDIASDKSDQYKLKISEFLLITLRKTYRFILKNAAIDLIDIFDKLADESNVEIRNTSLNCLALIKVRLFEYVIAEGLMEEINEDKMGKIDEMTKMINYDKSYDVDSINDRIIESPVTKILNKKVDSKLETEESNKSNILNKNENQDIVIMEPKSKKDKNNKAITETPNETKTDLKAINVNLNLDDVVIPSKSDKSNKMIIEIPNEPKNDKSKNVIDVVVVSNPVKNKNIIEIPIDAKPQAENNDEMEIPITNKKNQQQADLEEFERKLEEAMKKENEKRNDDDGAAKKSAAVKKAAAAKKAAATTVPENTKNIQKGNNDDDDDTSKLSKEEIEEKLNSLLGSEAATLLGSAKWDEKRNGLIILNEWINENINNNISLIQSNVENIVVFIKIKLKDFKEVNFNIIREAMSIYTNLISNFSGKGFEKRFTLQILKGFAEKIADVKLKENMSNLLYAMMENQGPKFIMTNILKIIEKKAPSNNALKEYSAFFEKAVDDFGIGLTPVKEMIDLCKLMAANANPQVRNASTSLICVLYKYVGKDIRTLLKDIKESTLKVIEAELDKITVLDANAINAIPKRQLKAAALKEEGLLIAPNSKSSSSKNNAPANIIDSLIPRQDISKKITPKLLKDISEGKWQEKKEAGEAIEKILNDANMKILPTGLSDLFGTIKAKLSDGNKNLVRLIVNMLSKLIDSIGSPFKSFTKPLSTPLLNNLSDKQQLLREDVIVCMDKWVLHCGLDSLIIYLPALIQKQENFEMRTELLKFLHKYKESFVFIRDKCELKDFVGPMLACLQDKNNSIRNSADEMIAYLLRFVPLVTFMNGLKDYKTAIANTLKTMLEKYKGMNMEESFDQNAGESSQNLNNRYNRSGEAKKDYSDNSLTPKKNKKHETPGDNKIKMKLKADSSGNLNTANNNNNLSVIKIGKNSKGENVNNITNNPSEKEKNAKRTKNEENSKNIASPRQGPKKQSNNSLNLLNYNSVFIPVHNIKNVKDKRLEIDKRYKFNLDTINEDFEFKLRDQLKQVLTSEILEKLFHQDMKHNIEGIITLTNIIKEDGLVSSGMFDVLDLILKWVGWKSYNNQNPLLIKLVIEFCDNLIEKIGENDLNLNETEGYILVAVLVDKLGNNNAKLKEISKMLLEKSLNHVTTKISTLVSSSAGKNSKVKIECIDMCTDLISSLGINIATQKDVKAIAKMLNTNDNNLKNSIIKFLGEIYTEVRDNLWAILNDFPEKTKEMLYSKFSQMGLVPVEESYENSIEERNNESEEEEEEYNPYLGKNSQDDSYKDLSVKTTGNVSQASITSQNNQKANIIINTNNTYLQNSVNIANLANKNKTDLNDSQSNMVSNQKLNTSGHHTNIGINQSIVVENITDRSELIQILNNLNSGEISDRVNTILVIHELIFTRFNQTKHILIPNIDIIIKSFIIALKILFQNKNPYDIPLKLGKYLLTVLYKISSNKELIKNISYNVLFDLSEEVLTNLLIENLDKVGENQEGLIIVRSLNSTMLRVLENCNYTEVITILLELVKKYRTHEIKSKISGLAIKCLLKINQILDQILQSIEVDKILIKIHELLIDFDTTNPELEVKNQTDQMVIRYIKNLINELVKLKKDAIVNDYLKGVEMHRIKDKYIKRWIRNVLLSMSDNNKPASSNKVSSSYSNINTMTANTSRQTSSSDNMQSFKTKVHQTNKSRSPVVNHTRKSLKNISPSESSSPVKTARNSVMYDKMINLKSKLANFNNNSSNLVKPGAISNKKALNNTCIVSSPSVYEMTEETNYRNFNNDKANRWENTSNNSSTSSGVTKSSNQPIMSKINELKKKWNEVSSKNKNLNTTTYSPHRNDINKSIDDSMTFSNANNADIRLLEEKRLMAIKLKNQSGKR